jgi:uncharacterized protein YggE
MHRFLPFLLCAVVLVAQTPAAEGPPNVRATGEGVVTTRPDQAILHIGVITQGQTAEAAGSQNARQSSSVIAELKQAVGSNGEIKTVGYSLNPTYRYPRDGGTPTITGYTASNTLEVKLNELSRIGQVIDVSTRVGANNIGGIQYALRNEQSVRAEALAEASRAARANAEAMAAALGLKVLRVRSADAGFVQAPRPMMAMAAAAARAEAVATPVETGTIEIRATVTITLDVGP